MHHLPNQIRLPTISEGGRERQYMLPFRKGKNGRLSTNWFTAALTFQWEPLRGSLPRGRDVAWLCPDLSFGGNSFVRYFLSHQLHPLGESAFAQYLSWLRLKWKRERAAPLSPLISCLSLKARCTKATGSLARSPLLELAAVVCLPSSPGGIDSDVSLAGRI